MTYLIKSFMETYLSMLPWIFPGNPLKANGAPGNIQGNLTHWGRATHICVSNLTIIGSDNGLSPGRRQAITWTNVGILLIGPLGTNFSEMLIEIHTFLFKKILLKMSSGKWRLFCLGLTVLNGTGIHHCHWTTQLCKWSDHGVWPVQNHNKTRPDIPMTS